MSGPTASQPVRLRQRAQSTYPRRRSRSDRLGEDAFKLHDTYGFPIDLTRIMAEERGMTVDVAGYEKLMEQARELARSGGKDGDTRLFELAAGRARRRCSRIGVKPTDDSAKFNAAPIGATVKAIWDGAKLLDQTHGAEAAEQGVAVILDKTNFYAEMGGQVGDTGELRSNDRRDPRRHHHARRRRVRAARRAAWSRGTCSVGDHVTATLAGVRPRTEKNHTATHLANWALREVLGDGVQQKGSLVDPEKLRFDFSHGKALGDDELGADRAARRAVHREEAAGLRRGSPAGAGAEDQRPAGRVRREVPADGPRRVDRRAGRRPAEGPGQREVAAVLRRVLRRHAPASAERHRSVRHHGRGVGQQGHPPDRRPHRRAPLQRQLSQASELDRTSSTRPHGARGRTRRTRSPRCRSSSRARRTSRCAPSAAAQAAVAELQAKLKAWEKTQKQSSAGGGVDAVAARGASCSTAPPSLGPGKLVVGEIPGAGDDQLLAAIDSLREEGRAATRILLASAGDGKVNFVAAVSDDLIAKGLKAGDWIRETAKVAGGGGGGRPQMAQAGGKDPSKLPDALARAASSPRAW